MVGRLSARSCIGFFGAFLFAFFSTLGYAASPVVQSTPVTSATEDVEYTYAVSGSDADNDSLTWSAASALPAWLSLGSGSNTTSDFGSTISAPGGIAIDADGNVYVAQLSGSTIYKITPDGTTTAFATVLASSKYGMLVSGSTLYISYYNANKITTLDLDDPSTGETDWINPITDPLAMLEKDGYIYVAQYSPGKVARIDLADDTVSDYVTGTSYPFGIGFASNGDLYIASYNNRYLSKYSGTTLTADIMTFASSLSDVKIDENDYIYVSTFGSGVKKISPDLATTIDISTTGRVWGMTLNDSGTLLWGINDANKVVKLETGAVLSGTPTNDDVGVHDISLQLSDGTNDVLHDFQITVANTNDAPTDITLSASSIGVTNTGTGVDVATLSTADVDVGDTHTYSLVSASASDSGTCTADTHNSNFQIASSTLQTQAAIAVGDYDICVQTDDGTTTFQKSFTITVTDNVAPAVALSAPAAIFNAAFPVTITFDEPVTGFIEGDIAVVNASLSDFTDMGGGIYTVTVTPASDGAVSLDVAANSAIDGASNGNTAATQLSVTYDASQPSVVISSAASTINAAFTATITFNEDVTGFVVGDISASNASLSSFNATSASVYTVTVTPSSEGAFTLDVAANVATDAATNNNIAATQFSATYDITAPTVVITSSESVVNAAFTATITFSEDVTGFAVGDISVTNANLSSFNTTSASVYSVLVTPSVEGNVTLDIASDVASDSASNGNTAASQFTVIYDTSAPTLASSTPTAGATDIDRDTDITLSFSEAIYAGSSNNTLALYDAADDSLVASTTADNGAVAIDGSDVVWTTGVTLTPSQSYYVQLGGGAFYDVADNYYAGISDTTTLTFTVFNAAPLAANDSQTTAEDNAVAINVLVNDSDSDSSINAASTTVTVAPSNGSTSVNTATGVITYTPNDDFNGSDGFTYTVSDVYGQVSNGGLVTLTVTAVNDAPVAVNDLASTAEDNSVSIDVAANDTDVDTGDSVDATTLTVVSQPVQGTAVVTAGEIVYTPDANFNGSDSFTYTIDDQNGGTSNAATVLININGVNDVPVAVDDSASTNEDEAVAIDALANDSDVDGSLDATTVMVMTNPANGSLSVDALTGEITYTPDVNFYGNDSFTYVVQDDASGTSNIATVSVTVNSVNDAPVANDDTAVLLEDTPHLINVVGNDSDVDGTLNNSSLVIGVAANNGSTTLNGDGTITYTPSANFNGNDSFTYTVNDNQGATSAEATVTITVTAVNDEPTANDDSANTDEDNAVVIDLAANDSDVDGIIDGSSFTLVSAPLLGNVTSNDDGTVTYTPNDNSNGNDSFSYSFDDDEGASSNTATVNVTVTPVNDAPTISGTPATSINEDSNYTFIPDGADIDNAVLTYSATGLPDWLSIDPSTGELSGTPSNEDVGASDSIVISVSDGELSADLTAFTLTVINTNDAPMIEGTPSGSVDEDSSYSFMPAGSDVDAGDNLSYTAANLPSWASIDPNTGAITGTPANENVGIYRDIIVTVNDGTTTTSLPAFSLTVANTNDAPAAAADSYSTSEGEILQVTYDVGVLANDSDEDVGDTLTATLVTGPTRASNFTLNGDGSFNYRHNGSETRSDSFTYALSDGSVTLPATTVNIAIAAVNDAPRFVGMPNVLSVTQGETFTYSVLTSDPDSVTNLALTTAPSWLSLENGLLSGVAPYSVSGDQMVTLTVEDQEYAIEQSFTLTVAEAEATVVSLATTWVGLPLTVDKSAQLAITLAHEQGPELASGELLVTLNGSDFNSQLQGCTDENEQYRCSFELADGTSDAYVLDLTPAAAGDVVITLEVRDTQSDRLLAQKVTDVSVQATAVQQGNNQFPLAKATVLASLNITEDADKELVAGTELGDDVKLLEYAANSDATEIFGSIDNSGETEALSIADVDGDGYEDILVVNSAGDATAVYYNLGDTTFAADAASQDLPYATNGVLRDLTDDGLPELILGGDGFKLYIYQNIDGVFSEEPYVFNTPTSVVHFALLKRTPSSAPLSGTLAIASQEAVYLVRFGLGVSVEKAAPGTLLKVGSAQTDQVIVGETLATLPIPNVSALKVQDLDGNGDEELVISAEHSSTSATAAAVNIITVTNGTSLTPVATLGSASAQGAEIADFNGDGAVDILVANSNDSYQFYYGTGGSVTEWTAQQTMIFTPSTLVLPEDINGDGQVDVVIYEDTSDIVKLYLSQNGSIGQSANLSLLASASVVSNTAYQWQYVATVTNPAAETVTNVALTLSLPAGVTVASKPEACNVVSSTVTCTVDHLPSGSESFSFVFASGSKPSGSVTATVTSAALDSDASNNTDATEFSPLFSATQVRVEGGGKSGGSVGWLALIMISFLSLRKFTFSKIQVPRCKSFITLLVALGFAVNSQADDSMYVEVNLGKATSQWNASSLRSAMNENAQEISITHIDDQRNTQELLLGYRLKPALAVELGYRDWGEISYSFEGVASDPNTALSITQANYPASGKGVFLGLRGSYWPENKVEAYAKLSAWDWSGEYTTYINNEAHNFKTGDTALVASVGMNVYFVERYSAGMIYQTARLDGQRNAVVGISLGVRF